MSTPRAVLVPGAPALLPSYAGQVDPLADLRGACREAVGALVAGRPRRVLVVAAPARAEDAARGVRIPLGRRLAEHLLREAGHEGDVADGSAVGPRAGDAVLLVGNGSACRSEKAPGHLDARAAGFDAALERSLRDGTPPPEKGLAEELWCFDVPVFQRLRELVDPPADVRYAEAPYGVAYWVATWPRLRSEARS